ncbi:hypothetical protein HY495_03780 [Candidatus Woesearchaeota archaeon]|nr:hypothetical protein [Candidatus Woesearchaeota archaeon]
MTSPIQYATQGTRILLTSLKNKIKPPRYDGSAGDICRKVINDCWNGRFFQTSTNNFPQFWSRDFGWCTQSLLTLGHEEKVHQTLRYALNRFKQANQITTTITPGGKPFDFPAPAVDSLPWLIHSIRLSAFPHYEHRVFLNQQIKSFFDKFINPLNGLVKLDLHVSSMKDFAVRKSSCYDNCMAGMLAADLKKLKLDNPFEKYDYPAILTEQFWNGSFFFDDLAKKNYVAGDANIFPFITGLIFDRKMLASAIQAVEGAGLADPFPLKYTTSRRHVHFVWQEKLMPNYESDALWTHMGPLYIKLLQHVDKDKAALYTQRYTQEIEKAGNYLEVYTKDGRPYATPLYTCDRGMLWAANYLTL